MLINVCSNDEKTNRSIINEPNLNQNLMNWKWKGDNVYDRFTL